MNLVVGATGKLGTEICELLRARGEAVRALVRKTSDPATVQKLRASGAEIVIGDLKQPASLPAACEGVEVIFSTATVVQSQQPDDSFDAVDDAGQRALIDAARASNVEQFIFVSVSGNIRTTAPLIDAKRSVERYLVRSGLVYTVLRASAFFEVWLGPLAGFDHANGKATILGTGQQRISYVSQSDVAAFAIACAGNPRAYNRIIELGGPEPITPRQAIAVFEQVRGRPYEVQAVPQQALEAQYAAADHPVQKSFAALMLALAADDVIPMDDLSSEFGVRLSSLKQVAPRIVQT